MMNLSCNVLKALCGKTLATAESCTGGGIGAALTAIPGISAVYKGGIISYSNEVKCDQLGVDPLILDREGAVSALVAEQMASGGRERLQTDVCVSVTGLAGPDGDEYGNPVGTVYIGYADSKCCVSRKFYFAGDRDQVRRQAIEKALEFILEFV